VSSYRKFLYILLCQSFTLPPGEGWHLDYMTLPPYWKPYQEFLWKAPETLMFHSVHLLAPIFSPTVASVPYFLAFFSFCGFNNHPITCNVLAFTGDGFALEPPCYYTIDECSCFVMLNYFAYWQFYTLRTMLLFSKTLSYKSYTTPKFLSLSKEISNEPGI